MFRGEQVGAAIRTSTGIQVSRLNLGGGTVILEFLAFIFSPYRKIKNQYFRIF